MPTYGRCAMCLDDDCRLALGICAACRAAVARAEDQARQARDNARELAITAQALSCQALTQRLALERLQATAMGLPFTVPTDALSAEAQARILAENPEHVRAA